MDPKCSTRGRDGLDRPADGVIAELATRQHGVVAIRQLHAAGITPDKVQVRLVRGALHRVCRGVYAVGHRRLTLEGRWMTAVLACGPGAVLSHGSAAQLWGMLPRSAARPHVSRPLSFRGQEDFRCHRARLSVDEVSEVDGIPVTAPWRTLLDVAAATERSVERALNEAEVLGLTDLMPIRELLRRHRGRRGAAVLRGLLDERERLEGVARSFLEERFLSLVRDHRLPPPQCNAPVVVGGRRLVVDCLWEAAGLVVELDGRAFHGTDGGFQRDRLRDRLLLVAGYRVVRLTWAQVRDEPSAIAAQLAGLTRALPAPRGQGSLPLMR